MKNFKVLKEKKKNSSPNTEFKIQIYEEILEGEDKGKFKPKKGESENENEFDIIEKIKLENNNPENYTSLKSSIYRTLADNNFTIITANKTEKTESLKSVNNKTKEDNITTLKEFN